MVALDLDGTTLNSDHALSEMTKQVLRRVSATGILITIATGRSISTVTKYVDELNLPVPVPIICFNGSIGFTHVANSTSSTPLFSNPMKEDSCQELLEFAERHGNVAQYYNGLTGEIFAAPKTQEHVELLQRYSALVELEQTVVDSFDAAIQAGPSAKLIILTSDPDELIRVAKAELRGSYNIIKGSSYFVEFLDSGMSKGKGLLEMCKHLGNYEI